MGIDVFELIKLANCHPRVNILTPGVGVGGHCIAVDPWFIYEQFPAEEATQGASGTGCPPPVPPSFPIPATGRVPG